MFPVYYIIWWCFVITVHYLTNERKKKTNFSLQGYAVKALCFLNYIILYFILQTETYHKPPNNNVMLCVACTIVLWIFTLLVFASNKMLCRNYIFCSNYFLKKNKYHCPLLILVKIWEQKFIRDNWKCIIIFSPMGEYIARQKTSLHSAYFHLSSRDDYLAINHFNAFTWKQVFNKLCKKT